MKTKVGHFQICQEMAHRGMDIRLSLLTNITNMQVVNRGGKITKITIATDGDVLAQIMRGHFVGGLLLCDKEQYFAVQAELENATSSVVGSKK